MREGSPCRNENQGSRSVRPPAVAGRFYPRDPAELRKEIERLFAIVHVSSPAPKAVIAPHAGYMYSGPIAATAFAQLAPDADIISKIVLIGPAHFVEVQRLAVPASSSFETPLGRVLVDRELLETVTNVPGVEVHEDAHVPEHSLEVEIPFLQVVLREFTVLPLLVGDASAEVVSAALDAVWGGDETRIVISSDLSHYHEWKTAQILDHETASAIEGLAPEKIGEQRACGRRAIQGLLQSARRHGLKARTLDLRNSGDTAGPRDRVVGYGAFGFYAC